MTDRQIVSEVVKIKLKRLHCFFFLFFYFSPSTRVHVVPFTGGLLLLLKATGAAREPTPRPFTTVGEPIPRTGRHWELNLVPLDLQTNALPTELTGRLHFPNEAVHTYLIVTIACKLSVPEDVFGCY